MTARLVTPDKEAEFTRRWNAGESCTTLSGDFGGCTAAMSKTAQRLGLRKREQGAQRTPLSDEQTSAIFGLWDSGLSIVAVAHKLDLTVWVTRREIINSGRDANRMGYGRSRRGPTAGNWKGGRRHDRLYVQVYLYPEDPFFSMANSGTHYVSEHRLVMARHLGRPLLSSETVHHIDGDGHNNALENLQLRQGLHGRGAVMACLDCGSHRIGAVPLAPRA